MKRRVDTIEAWQVYAARCKRLDAEEAKVARPFWKTLRRRQIVAILAAELGSVALLVHLARLL